MGYHATENAKRKERGLNVLEAYRAEADPGEDWDTVASDLFADLFHAAPGRYDFIAAINRAKDHFFAELREANNEEDR